jgi:hypothetical protein
MNIVAVGTEAQLFKEWFPMMKQSDIVYEVSLFRKLVYFRNSLPWPMKQRESYL